MQMIHVTIMTKCLNESVQFYEEQVGLSIVRDMRDNPEHQIVFMSDKSGGTCVELVNNPTGAYYGGGISMGFAVEDIDKEYTKKEEQGFRPGPMISPNPHARFFFVKDPNGVDIQFIQED